MSALWIDTDMGSDDVFAIIAAHAHRRIDGVSLVSGNAPLPQVVRNAHRCSAAFGWEFPFYAGADRPILGPLETAERILGPEGLPVRGEGPLLPQVAEPALPAFLEPLCDWLQRDDGPRHILALGPLTNLALLALVRPELIARIDRLVWMGGAVGRGNHTPSAEFNAFADPEAVQIVLDRGMTPDVIDLDACRKVLIDEDDVTAQAENTSARGVILTRLLGGYLDIALSRGRKAMGLYDPVAAAAMIAPEHFTFAPAETRVECAGPVTRGRTATDFISTAPNSRYAVDLDAEAIRTLCLGALTTI
ncbi:nucleoside hydrolase [Thalassorhabdomicrobium marinisediminis]|uniref:Nucleoside hydrolase n=1 Tax=Thalassorhabdomicrobium marinisediminis TaxID=2170577 RepID=A0A2T7FX85_9RHOB|nr:nucleoside hydrolase [Thalassorhabdomicrobium marinisediminis]PVA06780.1 nucleoside hydrolase [Thalassorhabdomicrobium marinisediminis]